MARVRVRQESNKLFLDFRYQGERFREQTLLTNTAKNRKQLETLLQRMEAKMLLGEFRYEEFFPGSKNLKKLRASSPSSTGTNVEESASTTPTFEEFAHLYLSEVKVQWRASHTRNIESILSSSLIPAFKGRPIGEITKAEILNMRTKLAARKGRGTSGLMAPKTINSHMALLKMILAEAAERFEFDSPYRNIKPLKLQRTHIEPFSLQEVEKIIATVREDYRNYYLLRFYTGLRTGEIDGLTWDNVDFSNKEVLVRKTLIQGRTEYTKTDGSQREIPMFGPVYQALKDQYSATGSRKGYVFCNQAGQPLDHNNVTKRVWYPLLRRLGLEKRRPYQTRHTAATLLLASGENPEWVARMLGHSSTEMLFKVYSRYIPNLTRMDGSAFERLIGANTAAVSKETGHDSQQ